MIQRSTPRSRLVLASAAVIALLVLSTGSVFAAGSDVTYTKKVRRQPGRFYSDHQFYWALIGPAPRT